MFDLQKTGSMDLQLKENLFEKTASELGRERSLKIEASILKTLTYFDLFRYPLKVAEIKAFIDLSIPEDKLLASLNDLVLDKRVFILAEFYSLQDDLSLIERRRNGNKRASSLLHKAEKIAKLIYRFPYVRGVAISGSVSKNFADEKADIDYFIITKANRLWIARTLLHLFKKLPFLKNRDEYYCMNYFIDEAELLIEEKNIYTATELFTIIPMICNGSMKRLFETNTWSHNFFPNLSFPPIKEEKNSFWHKQLVENIFDTKIGNWLENYFFRLTTKRWKKKEEEKRRNMKGKLMGIKTSKHCSKPNPIFFHNWFLAKYDNRLKEVLAQYQEPLISSEAK